MRLWTAVRSRLAAGAIIRCLGLVLLLAALLAGPAQAQAARPEGQESGPHREQVWRIGQPADDGRSIAAIVFRPPDDSPAPLVVMAHHTSAEAARNGEARHGVYPHAVNWFVERGYVVAVVHRRGYGLSGGERAERFACRRPNHIAGGRADAADLGAAIDALTSQPFVRRGGVIVVGQSTGGWATLALAAENHPAVAGIVNFAGGRLGRSGETGGICAIDELVRDAAVLGRRARTPTLWIYSDNDRSFPPALARRLYQAFVEAGGVAEFVAMPAFAHDGHALLPDARGIPLWEAAVEGFILRFR
ncbi:MAG: prolyl oligopeptidase family serine peptidase [Rhizobiales bacterium]|nr:prolyl oligopeptidase family serine peptidase [Hyphomicrobiales bacterium]